MTVTVGKKNLFKYSKTNSRTEWKQKGAWKLPRFQQIQWFKWLSLSLMVRRWLNPFQLQNQIIISESVLKHSFWRRAEQSLKEKTKREPFKLQVWKNSALWIVYSTGGEWGNRAIRPGMEGNCQMIYNPILANFKTQCWTNTSAYKEWCVAVGFTLTKTCEMSLQAHFC